jgi:hypothetical protein
VFKMHGYYTALLVALRSAPSSPNIIHYIAVYKPGEGMDSMEFLKTDSNLVVHDLM